MLQQVPAFYHGIMNFMSMKSKLFIKGSEYDCHCSCSHENLFDPIKLKDL